MIAELVAAATLLAGLTTARAQDVPMNQPAARPAGRTAVMATQDAIEDGRTVPARLPGWPAWSCTCLPRGIVCGLTGLGPERSYRAGITYRAEKGQARITVLVRPA